MKNKIIILLIAVCAMSCNKFLDEMPDNRAELDSEVKLEQLMRSAYPGSNWFAVAEFTSDNIDECPHWFRETDPFYEELFFWKESQTPDNESPGAIWEHHYGMIATANNVLQAIDLMGGPTTPKLKAIQGEALVVRAYGHFILVNIFCQHYSPDHAETDMGIPYITEPETTLNPMYDRGTVAEVYRKIEADLLEGLPLIDDAIYNQPKWRFNRQAAHTFASRFFLFYQKWEETIEHSTLALGSNPREFLRDNYLQASFPNNSPTTGMEYSRSGHKCNFLLATVASAMGVWAGAGYGYIERFSHTTMIAYWETIRARGPWGPWQDIPPSGNLPRHNTFIVNSLGFQGAMNRVMTGFFPYLFEVVDPVARTGYWRSVHVLLSAEEALLNRAEANVMRGRYGNALADINHWVGNTIRPPDGRPETAIIKTVLTQQDIIDWANSFEFYKPTVPTPKKELNPDFPLLTTQRNYMYLILHMRRHEFMHGGMRLFDLKRYGIEVERRMIAGTGNVPNEGNPDPIVISLYEPKLIAEKRSPKLVIQIPPDVISAGMPKNPTELLPTSPYTGQIAVPILNH
ncbi:MAG: RagB/SusD family nutrient uptake outer membrane protein [Bacteroidales bacterium]|nr:RagB/SusD family nutrient uptake outer membrane protein [Bacteroidales bacterium]